MIQNSIRKLCCSLFVLCLLFSAHALFGARISPSATPLNLTVFPYSPIIEKVVGAESQTTFTQLSCTQSRVGYNMQTNEKSGFVIHYDNFGTTPVETTNLSAFSSFVFAFKGNSTNARVEFKDYVGGVAHTVTVTN